MIIPEYSLNLFLIFIVLAGAILIALALVNFLHANKKPKSTDSDNGLFKQINPLVFLLVILIGVAIIYFISLNR